jgi:hypothetical protein
MGADGRIKQKINVKICVISGSDKKLAKCGKWTRSKYRKTN